jgi:hypothetical protein
MTPRLCAAHVQGDALYVSVWVDSLKRPTVGPTFGPGAFDKPEVGARVDHTNQSYPPFIQIKHTKTEKIKKKHQPTVLGAHALR